MLLTRQTLKIYNVLKVTFYMAFSMTTTKTIAQKVISLLFVDRQPKGWLNTARSEYKK